MENQETNLFIIVCRWVDRDRIYLPTDYSLTLSCCVPKVAAMIEIIFFFFFY